MGKIIAIDPGANGALAMLDSSGKVELIKIMPKIASGFDGIGLNDIIESILVREEIECVFIEQIHALFGSSAGSTFTFGQIYGMIEGLVIAHHLKYVLVQPKEWQKEMFQGVKEIRKPSKKNKKDKEVKGRVDTKEMSAIAAKRLFPNEKFLPTERCTKIHDGMTDSLLICEYGRRRLNGKV